MVRSSAGLHACVGSLLGQICAIFGAISGLLSLTLLGLSATACDAARSPETSGSLQQAVTTRIEAETFTNNSGVGLETCSEGGQNVMDVGDGEWASYSSVDFNGLTQIRMRVASANFPATVEFRRDTPTGQLYAVCNAPNTGGWQTWTTISCNASGASGNGTLVMLFHGASAGSQLPNVNWIELVKSDPAGVGAKVEAESGIGTGTQIENGSSVGYFDQGDNIAFSNINLTGVTGLGLRVAGQNAGGVMEIRVDSTTGTLLGSYTMASTGSWTTWVDASMTFAATTTGVHTLYLVGASGGTGILNLDYFTLSGAPGSGVGLGSTVQAESGVQSGTQLENGNTTVGYFDAGDSMKFAGVNLTGVTGLDLRVAGETSGGVMQVRIDSTSGTLLGSYTMVATGAWQTYQTRSMTFSATATGVHDLYLVGASGSGIFNIDYFKLTSPCTPSAEVCDGTDNDCDGQVDEGGVCCTPSAEVCDGADNDCDGLIDEDNACGTGSSSVVPLFSAATPLQPALSQSTPTALVTSFADRGRDRHARENVFKAYEHFLTWYWEDRTIEGKVTDTIGRGGTTIRFDVKSLQKLSAREGRMFYMGLHTVAEYCDNSPLTPAYADGSPMPQAEYDAMQPDQAFYYFKTIDYYLAPLTCAYSPLAVGQQIELEISQFLDHPNHGRSNYYGTAFMYVVGQGFVPWEATGPSQNPFLGMDCGGPCGITNSSLPIATGRLLGGGTTTHRMESGEGESLFLEMATNIAPSNVQPWMLGRRLLHSSAIDGVHDENPAENPPHPDMIGLAGPSFINKSCQSCHERNTRALPPAVGAALDKWVFKVGDANGNPHPAVGKVFQPAGSSSEGAVTLGTWVNQPGGLRSPSFNFTGTTFNGTPPSNFSPRITPQLVGLGLLEAINESDVFALADANDANGDGISGRAQVVTDVGGITRLGRFGWKAMQPSLRQQVAGALNTDMGVTTSVFPTHDCGSAESGCGGTSQELSDTNLDLLVTYVSLLGIRPQDAYSGNGATVFQNAGCAKCHAPTFVTSGYAPFAELRNQTIHPYTDLLLHDMGPGLADSLKEGTATTQEWRTPPLWSIGKTDDTHAGDQAYLHDGRARTLEEAILWHGGEGTNAKNAYVALAQSDKDALIAFLQSL